MDLKTSVEEKTSSHIRDFSKIALKISARVLSSLYVYLSKCNEN